MNRKRHLGMAASMFGAGAMLFACGAAVGRAAWDGLRWGMARVDATSIAWVAGAVGVAVVVVATVLAVVVAGMCAWGVAMAWGGVREVFWTPDAAEIDRHWHVRL